jgi:hypothetical protein
MAGQRHKRLDGRKGGVGPRGRAWRAVAAALTAAAFTLAGFPTRASAQEPPVAVDQAVVSEQLFAALVQIRDGGNSGVAHLLLSAELLEWRRQTSWASGQEMAAHFAARRQALAAALTVQDQALPEPDFALRVVNVLMATPPSNAASAEHVRLLLESTLGRSVTAFDMPEDLASGGLRMALWLRGKAAGEGRTWAAVRSKAVEDPAFAEAWNTVIGADLGLDAAAGFDTLKGDPTLATFIDVDAILALQGSPSLFVAEARRQYGLVVARLLQESQQARARVAQVSSTCPPGPVVSPTCTPEEHAAAKATAKEEQKEIDAAASAAKVLGALVGLTDPKAGQKMEKAATALFSIVTAINKYAEAVAGKSAADAIFSAAALGLAGNIFGAVTTLVGLFSESGPSLDQQILEQVAALRQEVRALHQEMRQSFERIDVKLNVIFEAMMTEFAKLNITLAGHTEALIDIQNALAAQQLRLEEVAAIILAAIGHVELQGARLAVTRYIGHLDTYGVPIPTEKEYQDTENEFYFAATETSTHEPFVVPPSRASDSTVQPATVLDDHGEANAIGYLARLAHFRDPSVPEPADLVPNPGVWNFGAQAYSLLQLQNPEYAADVLSFRADQVAAAGERIIQTARSFSQPAAAPDTAGHRTNAVFKSLVQDYGNAVAALSAEMSAIRTQQLVVRDEPGGEKPLAKTYNLFGAPNQALPDSVLAADEPKLTKCTPTASNPPIFRPANVSYRKLAPELRFAYHAFSPTLGETPLLPQLSQCYDVAWTAAREVTSSLATDTYARLQLSVRTRFRWRGEAPWRNARSATYTWPETRIARECNSYRCTDPFYVTPEERLAARWNIDRGLFEQYATISLDNALLAEARTTMTAFLQGRQRALYYLVADGIANVTPLSEAVARMNNAARQLQAYTRLGFPIALAADEILSSVLFGHYAILVNRVGNPQVQSTFNLAFNNYACTANVAIGEPCLGGPFFPLRDQPFLETFGGATSTQPVFCGVSTSVAGSPGDPVGDCLVASARQRLNTLTRRYAHHSQLLAAGAYVERLPWVGATLDTLSLVNTLVHTPPSN